MSTITPPPELVQQWASEWMQLQNINRDIFMATRAAQWGADQELEACCEVLDNLNDGFWSEKLRATRRPKPPSLKEQALDLLHVSFDRGYLKEEAADTIRRALEQLDD